MAATDTRNLVLNIVANNRASAGFKAVNQWIEQTRKNVQATADRVDKIQKAGGPFRHWLAEAQQARGALGLIGQSIRRLEQEVQKAQRVTSKIFDGLRLSAMAARTAISGMLGPLGSLLNIGKALGVVFGGGVVAGLGAIGKTGVDMIATLKGAEATLTSILGNRGTARQFVKALEQEAAQSLPTFKDLLPAAVQLAQVYGPQGLGKVIPTIRAFGDAAVVAAGGDTEALSRALAQFRQLVTRDNPTMEDLGLIGENLGVNVRSIIKDAFGTADMETLGKAGVTGMMIGDALVAGFQKKFGGAQKTGATGTIGGLMSGVSDAFNSISAQVSGGLYDSIMKTLKGFLDFVGGIQKSDAGKAALKTIEVLLTGVGRALELVAKQAQPFLDWLSKIATADNVVLFLSNVLALLQTIGGRVLKLFGVDLKAAMDPKNVTGWFEVLGQATAGAIDGAFGFARAFREAARIIKSAFEDVGDYFEDLTEEMTLHFKSMIFGLQESFNRFAGDLLGAIIGVIDGLNQLKDPLGNSLFNINTRGIREARSGFADAATNAWHGANNARMDYGEYQNYAEERKKRRMAEDPFRGQDPGRRLGDAFAGRDRDTSAQKAFWDDFTRSRMGIVKGLFAGATAQAPISPTGAGIQLFGSTPRGAASVTSRSVGAGAPMMALPMPASDPFASVRQPNGALRSQFQGLAPIALPVTPVDGPSADPFSPVRLPDGRTVSPFDPAAQRSGVQVQQSTGAGGARSVTMNFYPQNWQQMKQMVLQWIDEEERKSNPGASMAFP